MVALCIKYIIYISKLDYPIYIKKRKERENKLGFIELSNKLANINICSK